MVQIETSKVVFVGIELIGIALAVLDFTDSTKKLEEVLRRIVKRAGDWIAKNPIKTYVVDGFKTSIQYSAGVLLGGLGFIGFLTVLEGDVGITILAVALLVWTARSRLSRRMISGCLIAVLGLTLTYPANPDGGVATVYLVVFVTLLTILQVLGPVVLANVCYFGLVATHGVLRLLSRPKKGIVGTVSLMIAIGNPLANYLFQYARL